MPKLQYNSSDDSTYGWDDKGNYIGKQKGPPSAFNPATINSDPGTSFRESVLKGNGIPSDGLGSVDWKQFGKDTLVNALSQAPLMMATDGTAGSIAKILASLGLGTGGDQVLNPNKSLGESAGDAALNTGIGMAIPGMVENKYIPPNNPGGSTLMGKAAQMLQNMGSRLNPSNYEPRTNIQMLQPKPGMPNQPTAVPVDLGKMLQQQLLKRFGADVSPRVLRGLVPFAANTGIDATVNSTPQQ